MDGPRDGERNRQAKKHRKYINHFFFIDPYDSHTYDIQELCTSPHPSCLQRCPNHRTATDSTNSRQKTRGRRLSNGLIIGHCWLMIGLGMNNYPSHMITSVYLIGGIHIKKAVVERNDRGILIAAQFTW